MFKNKFISHVSMLAFVGFCAVSTSPLWADEDECDTKPTTTSICHLPDEARLEILRHLAPKDLASVTQVSQRWHSLAEDESLWKEDESLWKEDEKLWKKYSQILALEISEGTSFKLILKGACGSEIIDTITCNLNPRPSRRGYGCFVRSENKKLGDIRKMILDKLSSPELIEEFAKLDDTVNERTITRFTRILPELNNALAAQGDESAISRKIIGLAFGQNGYEKKADFLGNYIEFLKSAKAIQNLKNLKLNLETQERDFKAGKYRL